MPKSYRRPLGQQCNAAYNGPAARQLRTHLPRPGTVAADCRCWTDRNMRLKIQLPTNWTQQNNPSGPATFSRQGSTGALHVSWAEYRGAKPLPEITADSLKTMAIAFGQKHGLGETGESSNGPCGFGRFGTAVFRSNQHPRVQVWFISDGRDHIMATHICDREPHPSEVDEAQHIAASLALVPDQAPNPK